MATVNDQPLLSAKIKLQETGKWQADLEVDLALEPEDGDAFPENELGRVPVRIEHNGAEFIGTVETGDRRGERFQCRVVGGAGGLTVKLPARSYLSQQGVTLGQLLGDVLKESGESLSPTVTDAVKNRKLPRWTRTESAMERALEAIVKKAGLNWRILRDGTFWVGTDTFPEADIDAIDIDSDPSDGAIELAAGEEEGDPGPLLLDPCSTYNGLRILEVHHELSSTKFRTIARTTTLKRAVERLLEPAKLEIDYSRIYGAEVVAQNEDGTLELKPDTELVKGGGLSMVKILNGWPGSVLVPSGSRCALLWLGGDPTEPRAAFWSTRDLLTLLVGNGTDFVAMAGLVTDELNSLRTALNSLVATFNTFRTTHVHSGVTTGGGSSGPAVGGSAATDAPAVGSVASTNLKAD